jgi:hypothetical protein
VYGLAAETANSATLGSSLVVQMIASALPYNDEREGSGSVRLVEAGIETEPRDDPRPGDDAL